MLPAIAATLEIELEPAPVVAGLRFLLPGLFTLLHLGIWIRF